jgi:hypothetical protein
MNSYTAARQRGDTQGQYRAAERAKRTTHARLIEELRASGTWSGKKAAKVRRALG